MRRPAYTQARSRAVHFETPAGAEFSPFHRPRAAPAAAGVTLGADRTDRPGMLMRFALAVGCILLSGLPAGAADTVIGTFVANGKTHILKQVYVTRSAEADSPTTAYLT